MGNILHSKFSLRDQATTWYGALHHHEEKVELAKKPTLTDDYRMTQSRIFLNAITTLDDGQSKKRSITKIVESTTIKYNNFTGEEFSKETEHFIYNCNDESKKITITPERFYQYLTAINVMIKNWQVENPLYNKMIRDQETWCKCEKTYWNESIGYGSHGCWSAGGTLGKLDFYGANITNAQKDAILSSTTDCIQTSSSQELQSNIQPFLGDDMVKVKVGVNQWGDTKWKKGCHGCTPPKEFLIDYLNQDYIKSVTRPMAMTVEAWDSEITTPQEAEEFLLDFNNTYCFAPGHHWTSKNEEGGDNEHNTWETPEEFDADEYYDPDDPETNPHDLVEAKCKCLQWECPPNKNGTSNPQEVLPTSNVLHVEEGGEGKPPGEYKLTYFGGVIMNDYEKSVCVANPTWKPKHRYYIKQFRNNKPRYETHFLDRVGCKPILSEANLIAFDLIGPATHESGPTYTWCSDLETNYVDPGLSGDLVDCRGKVLQPGYDTKTLYFSGVDYVQNFISKNTSALAQNLPILDQDEIDKLGLNETIETDDGTKLNESSDSDALYSFSVVYVVTDIHGNQALLGRNINVIKGCADGSGSGD